MLSRQFTRLSLLAVLICVIAFAAAAVQTESADAVTGVTWGKPGIWAINTYAYVKVRCNAPAKVTWTGAQGNIYDENKKRITLCHENFKISSSYLNIDYNVKSQMRDPDTGEVVTLKVGKTYYVKFQAKYGGKWYSTDLIKFVVKKPAQRAAQFKKHKYWKEDLPWGPSQRPKYSTYDSSGCCAYAADFVKYLYGKNSMISYRAKYTKASSIRPGDVVHLKGAKGHWFVVLNKDGNKLATAEGSAYNKHSKRKSRTYITYSKYYLKNGKLCGCGEQNGTKLSWDFGYRYY